MANLANNHFQTASATDAGRRRTLNEDSLGTVSYTHLRSGWLLAHTHKR